MLVIASDHGGFALKQELMEHLRARGVEFEDIGTYSEESCDYPVYAEKAARGVAEGKYEKGILLQTVGDIEDTLDFEAIMEIAQDNAEHFIAFTDAVLDEGLD